MNPASSKKIIRVAPVALLVLLTALSFAYGLDPVAAIRHGGWYALGDVDRIPVWVLPIDHPLVDLHRDSGEGSTPAGAERVESWNVSSADVVHIMQEHELLTDWWRDEVSLAIDAGLPRDNPVVSSYVGTLFEVDREFRNQIPEDVLMNQLVEHNRVPGTLQAGGCKPSGAISRDLAMQYYNTGARQLCDNLIGGTQWLLAFSLIALGIAVSRQRGRTM